MLPDRPAFERQGALVLPQEGFLDLAVPARCVGVLCSDDRETGLSLIPASVGRETLMHGVDERPINSIKICTYCRCRA